MLVFMSYAIVPGDRRCQWEAEGNKVSQVIANGGNVQQGLLGNSQLKK